MKPCEECNQITHHCSCGAPATTNICVYRDGSVGLEPDSHPQPCNTICEPCGRAQLAPDKRHVLSKAEDALAIYITSWPACRPSRTQF